jgi:hypothetical protein
MKINFFFARRAEQEIRPVNPNIHPGISQNNSLSEPCSSQPIVVCRSWGSKCPQFSIIHILVYKLGINICPISPLFIGILPNNTFKSLYQTPKLFCFAKYFL